MCLCDNLKECHKIRANVQKSSTVTGMALVLGTLDCGSTSRPAFFRAAILAEMSETWKKKHNQVSIEQANRVYTSVMDRVCCVQIALESSVRDMLM